MSTFTPRPANGLLARAFLLVTLVFVGMQPAIASCLISNFTPTSISFQSPAKALVVSDFNKDGKPDVAVATNGLQKISILFGNGNGFAAPVTTEGGRSTAFMAAGDLNGDGSPDLVLANAVTVQGELQILFGLGNGTFGQPVAITNFNTGTPLAVAIADLNSDGKADLIATNNNPSAVAIRLGDGAGGFTFLKTFDSGGIGPKFIVTKDFNGDGKTDLAIVNSSGANSKGNVAIFLNDGNANFTAAGPFAVGSGANSLSVGDFNGDSKFDLAIVNQGEDNVAILLGDGTGNFSAAASVPTLGKGPEAVVNADFNGDGYADLAVSNADLGSVVVFSGDGSGKFSPVANYLAGRPSFDVNGESMAVLDINNDGQPDLISVNELARVAVAYVNSCSASPSARFEFSSFFFGGLENDIASGTGAAIPVVVRTGDLTSGPASVSYATSDQAGTADCSVREFHASSRCDYLTTVGTLHFSANEISRSLSIPITDDSYADDGESFNFTLSNPQGAVLGNQKIAVILISDNESFDGPNPIANAKFFVRQHYVDFFSREPDASGLAFWTNQITECQQTGATCDAEVRRSNVSAAFFLSIEFQQTGYLVYRMYKAGYGDIPGAPVPVRLSEFLPDTQQIGSGVVVGQTGWEQQLDNNKASFALDFVSRARFTTAYPTTLTPAQFVNALFANAGVTPSTTDRDAAINEFGGSGDTADTAARGRALRRVAENSTLAQQETNKAFVLMQYFGYLRRNPNDAPDADFGGYNYWLGKLNQFNGNFVNAEMVKAFILSDEYRHRFGA
jgi:hypothetical protein